MKNSAFEPAAGSDRIAYLNCLAVVQCFLLMIYQTASYQWYAADISSSSWLVLNIYRSAASPCLLLFIMISGAVMLGNDIPVRQLYRDHVLKLLSVFIIWDIIYAVITEWRNGIGGIIYRMFNNNSRLWLLLALIGLFICFPLIRLITENAKVMRYFLILSMIFAFLLPTLYELCTAFGGEGLRWLTGTVFIHIDNMFMNTVLGYPFFFIAGYYIHTNDINRTVRRIIYALGIISTAAGIAVNAIYVRMQGAATDTMSSSFMLHSMIPAIAVFIFFKYNIKENASADRIFSRMSGWSLGIYVVHYPVLLGMSSIPGLNALSFSPAIAVPVTALITFAVSAAISALLNLIPGVKKYLV